MQIIRGTGYKDLEIYHTAHELGVACHHFSLLLPKYELYETGSQLRRSSKSISANIVEGYCRRRYKAEFIRFLFSLMPLVTKQLSGWNMCEIAILICGRTPRIFY